MKLKFLGATYEVGWLDVMFAGVIGVVVILVALAVGLR